MSPFPPHSLKISLIFSLHSFIPYVFLISICDTLKSEIFDASLVKLCLPDPPTPTSKACEPGCLIILEILIKCSTANLKRTSSIGLSVMMLYWPRASSQLSMHFSMSRISSYGLSVIPYGTSKSPKSRPLISSSLSTLPSPSISRCLKVVSKLAEKGALTVSLMASSIHSLSSLLMSRSPNTRIVSCAHSLMVVSTDVHLVLSHMQIPMITLEKSRRLNV
mmetsp:Transcript_42407/g.49468  ORF Transcript_42407/g.49468 Transcript_42407/m.49468 type:complete len:220 (-) Transcript_42407:6403-7062(-)